MDAKLDYHVFAAGYKLGKDAATWNEDRQLDLDLAWRRWSGQCVPPQSAEAKEKP